MPQDHQATAMMKASYAERLQEVFRAVLELPPGSEVIQLHQLGTARWDSLAHVSLVAAIESEFGVTLDTGEALLMTSYEAAEQLLADKVGGL